MIKVEFKTNGVHMTGFEISGHAKGNFGTDIVCASVSSAAYMTANTVTEIIKAECTVEEKDGYMKLETSEERAEQILKGFELHITELAKQYPDEIKVKHGGK